MCLETLTAISQNNISAESDNKIFGLVSYIA